MTVTLIAANELEWIQYTIYIANNFLLNSSVLLVHINSNCSMCSWIDRQKYISDTKNEAILLECHLLVIVP
jgi:hypothetical protein